MNKVRPKMGFLPFQSQWFKDVGLAGHRGEGGPQVSFSETIAADAAQIVAILSKHVEVVSAPPASMAEEACASALKLVNEQVDLVLVCPLVWAEDPPLLKALPSIQDLPIVLWCYSPHVRPRA